MFLSAPQLARADPHRSQGCRGSRRAISNPLASCCRPPPLPLLRIRCQRAHVSGQEEGTEELCPVITILLQFLASIRARASIWDLHCLFNQVSQIWGKSFQRNSNGEGSAPALPAEATITTKGNTAEEARLLYVWF